MGLTPDLGFVLAVALITWGGVFLYLLRLERLARDLERQVGDLDNNSVNRRDAENAEKIEDAR